MTSVDTAALQILLAGGGAGLVLIGLGLFVRHIFREKDPHHGEHRKKPGEVTYLSDSGEFRLLHGRHREVDKDGPTTVMPRGHAIRVVPMDFDRDRLRLSEEWREGQSFKPNMGPW